jgi:hypothetical protein
MVGLVFDGFQFHIGSIKKAVYLASIILILIDILRLFNLLFMLMSRRSVIV